MAKKSTKPAPKSTAKSSKPTAKSAVKAVAKPIAKAAAKTATPKQAAKSAAPKKEIASDRKVAEKKPTAKSEASRPALMTARGKVKAEPLVVVPVAKAPSSDGKGKSAQRAAPSETSHDFESNGHQLISMAKEEMSKINKTGDGDKSAEKTSKFKPIKIERGNLSDEKAKWQELNKRYGKEKAVAYKMSDSFESLKPIQHKVLGWGFILTNDNNRLEVLFENGIKMLISNYKAN